MNDLYPLKFRPIFKDKIWGGNSVHTVFGMDFAPLPNCGEAWVLSGYGDEISTINNGFLANNKLDELIEVYMGDLVGEAVYEKYGNKFPMLIKILNSSDWLSIQVHPDDRLAESRHNDQGKTEMWYVADAEPGAQLISGFNQEMNKALYLSHLGNGTLKEIMNYEAVKKGDIYFIPAGRVHAIGPGLLIFEIQQTSDLTYRIYDFDRVDDKGNARQLHTDLALDALDFTKHSSYRTEYQPVFNRTLPVVESTYFNTSLIHFGIPVVKDYSGLDSFVILQCAEGECSIEYEGGTESLKAGEVLLVPAVMEKIQIVPLVETKLLEVYYPQN
ncbi:MAG: type I phosphomannose isomerase catalytic subunit [Bacteroidota bacterium]